MLHNLPEIRGTYSFDFQLGDISFFRVGGKCDVLFTPRDCDDLIYFLKNRPNGLAISVLGNMSNTLILDGGIRGCVINLRELSSINFYSNLVEVDTGIALSTFIRKCAEHGVSSCEKLFGIPGTMGGAIFMNAGAIGFEIADALHSVTCVDLHGKQITILKSGLAMGYRNGNFRKDLILTSAKFHTTPKLRREIEEEISAITNRRIRSQPIQQPTCGSTFKNPGEIKAWQLIKEAGCDGLSFGGAMVSDMHANFLINTGNAKASDFTELIKIIKKRVLEKTGVVLEEEIVTIGEAA